MGRPTKDGVDYFSLDCHMSDSVKLIEAEFGLKGFAIIIKLWQKIYSEKGYYTKWSRPVALMFAQRLNVGINVVEEVVNASLREGIFDQRLYKEYGILTSRRIQESYAAATRKRDFVKFEKEYLLIATPKNWVSSAENGVNSARNEVSDGERKEEESIVDNSFVHSNAREENQGVDNTVWEDGADPEDPYSSPRLEYIRGTIGEGYLLMSEVQFNDLCNKLSIDELHKYCAVVVDCEKNGKHYKKKSHYQAILDMAMKDRKRIQKG